MWIYMVGNHKTKTIRLAKKCKLLIFIIYTFNTMSSTFLFDTDSPNYRWLFVLQVNLCREVFGDTLNESRDPDRGGQDRYSSRFFLKHTSLEQAFDMLLDQGFILAGCSGTGTSTSASGNAVLQPLSPDRARAYTFMMVVL